MASFFERTKAAFRAFQGDGLRKRSASMRSPAWHIGGMNVHALARGNLLAMRAESRKLAMGNDHMRGFLRSVARNVVGDVGVRMQGRLLNLKGERDEAGSERLERDWADWGRVGETTVCGRFSFVQAQKLIMEQVARDGEVLVRLIRGYKNRWRFAIQILNADALDFNYHAAMSSGNEVRSGIEIDSWGRPVAYHVNLSTDGETLRRERILAEDILHLFVPLDAGQYRGWPWVHSAIRRLLKIGDYEDAALDAARKGAKHGGFFTNTSEEAQDYGPEKDQEPVNVSLENGTAEVLPTGYEFQSYDPSYPSAQFPEFMGALLRGVGTGLGVSYASLTGDLSKVNYSSARIGLGEERDEWSGLQRWLIEHFVEPVYRVWLSQAMLTGELAIGSKQLSEAQNSQWYPRRWRAVDPDKESRAHARDVELGITSRTLIAAQNGSDIRDVMRELGQERELAAECGIELGAAQDTGSAPVEVEQPDSGTN